MYDLWLIVVIVLLCATWHTTCTIKAMNNNKATECIEYDQSTGIISLNEANVEGLVITWTKTICELKNLTCRDLPKRESSGGFEGAGFNSSVWEITKDERVYFESLNKTPAGATDNKDRIDYIEKKIASINDPENLPAEEEAIKAETSYNNLQNEGGSGYVPHIVSAEEFSGWKKELKELK